MKRIPVFLCCAAVVFAWCAAGVFAQTYTTGQAARAVIGQETFTSQDTNSGKSVIGSASGIAYAADTLFVADSNGIGASPSNNRVLVFSNLSSQLPAPTAEIPNNSKCPVCVGQASVVLGQPDFVTTTVNIPATANSLRNPQAVASDGVHLVVADTDHNRVLIWNHIPTSNNSNADVVIGQPNFTSVGLPGNTPNAQSMRGPQGVWLQDGKLYVADTQNNRVLVFNHIPTTNGVAADIVLGAPNFTTYVNPDLTQQQTGATASTMFSPVAVTSDGIRLFVSDLGFNRVLIFNDPHAAGTAPAGETASAAITTGLDNPSSVYVSPVTGEIWVANSNAGNSLRYANYQSVLLGLGSINSITEASGNFGYSPLATIQDQYGDLFVADNAHRVAIYYPGVNLCNGASFLPTTATSSQYPSATCLSGYTLSAALPARPLAPGAIATLFPCDNCQPDQFGDQSNAAGSYPVPTTLSDIQVLVNGVAAPLYYAGAPIPPSHPTGQINFIVPYEAPLSGFADLEVVQASTGQVLGAAQVPMNSVAPGAFAYPQGQTGSIIYAAAINKDNTVNSATNPAVRGDYVSLYMTGQGAVPGEPADGVPSSPMPAQYPVTVLINGVDVNSAAYQEQNIQHILFSGINQYPGMWQINLQIPKTVVPTNGAVWFVAIINGVPNWDVLSPFKTYIYVK